MKKKLPAILEPDADDFCALIARGIIRLLESNSILSIPDESDSDHDQDTESSDTAITH